MTIRKLSAMPYAQAHVEIDEGNGAHLFSYVTRVADLDSEGWLTIYGLYSMTTRKHISAFLREYCPAIDFQTAKQVYNDGYRINVHTGEIVPVDEGNELA